MRIALISPRPQRRGAEVFARDLAEELRRRRHTVREIYLYPGPTTGGLPESCDEWRLDLQSRGWSERLLGWSRTTGSRLREALAAFGPEVVQVSGGNSVKYTAAAVGRLPGPPLFVYRNIGEPGRWVNGWRRRLLYHRYVFPRVDAAATVAREFVPQVERLCPHAMVRFIPSGLDTDRLAPTASPAEVRQEVDTGTDAPVALFAGQLSPEKRVDRLLRAFAEVTRSLPSAVLWIAGRGPLTDELVAQATDLGIADRVRFLGNRPDVGNFIAAADLVALTSDTEGLAGILSEAAALGRPVVATRVGATAEIVADGETGLLVDPDDEAALTDALLALLTDPQRTTAMGEAAARRFGTGGTPLEETAEAYESLYRDGLERLLSEAQS